MATDHCDTMMVKRENWYPDHSGYEHVFTNLDPFCQDSLTLHNDSDGKYTDSYWESTSIQPRNTFLQPSLECEDRLGSRKSCDLAAYEEGNDSTTTGSHAYSSSPSSINSQNCGEYPIPYYGHDTVSKKSFCESTDVLGNMYHDSFPADRSYYPCLRDSYGVSPLREEYTDPTNVYQNSVGVTQRPPVIKRRNTANRKERRRTQSINNAFADLRDCIPNVPADTKLSKIKTLRLATSYISYLMGVLSSEDPDAACGDGFKADLSSHHGSKKGVNVTSYAIRFSQISAKMDKVTDSSSLSNFTGDDDSSKKSKGRTGWPQHVWALELKQEQV